MRDCVTRLLQMDADAFPGRRTWRKARHMIAIELHGEGKTPAEAKEVLTDWARRTRNLTRNEERNQVADFVDWLYARPEVATISCSRKATMVQMGWCVGQGCEFREAQRKARNAQRSGPFNLTLWRRWQAHLIREYRGGAYIAATCEVLRDRWLERELVDGQPVYIGARELGLLAQRRVDGRGASKATSKHGMRALRWVHVLEEVGLIRIVSRGEHCRRKGFRKANGYLLLPMPPVPDGPAEDANESAPPRRTRS